MIEKIVAKEPTIYELNSKDAVVKIGGSMLDKFVPNINASKWDDECWLNINHPDSVTSESEEFTADKVSLKVGNNTHRCYALENGDLEYEVEYESRPAYDVETFDLSFPDGLIFAKQLSIEKDWERDNEGVTLEYYLATRSRPENTINSYAVYWNKQNNQYKTGKFCHIYRAELIDANGDRCWCDMDIDPITKKMKVIMEGSWLDAAVYPVILDPVLGYDTYGSSVYGDDRFYYAWVYETDAIGGNIRSWHCSIGSISGDPGIKLAIVDVDQITNSCSLKDVIEQIEIIPVILNTTINVEAVSKNLLSPSTKYGVAWITDGGITQMRHDSGLPSTPRNYLNLGSGSYPAAFSDPFPDGFTTGDVTSRRSTWIEYEPSEEEGWSPNSYYGNRKIASINAPQRVRRVY